MSRPPAVPETALRVAVVAAVVLALAGVGASVATTQSPDASIVARYPADDGSMVEETVVSPADVATVREPVVSRTGDWQVPVTLTESGAESFTETMVDAGFTSEEGISNCPPKRERNDQGYCLLTVVDGEAIYAAAMGPQLAEDIRNGAFVENPRFVLLATNESRAEQLAASFGLNATTTTTSSTAGTTSATETTAHSPTATTTDDSRDTDKGDEDAGTGGVPGFAAGGLLAALVLSVAAALGRREA
jgi:hypothetical protein